MSLPPPARPAGSAAATAGADSTGIATAGDVARDTLVVTSLTLVSRLTGVVRVLVIAAVLGTTFLGNTFQSANTVPNVIFELFAAGTLQAVMIPSLVERFDRGDPAGAEHLAGSVLGLALAGLGALAVAGMLGAPWLMRALVAGVESAEVRAAEVRLGTVLLWCFLPQVVLYAAGMVATAILQARGRFAAPVVAPIANNLVVVGMCGLFWVLLDGRRPGLDLSTAQTLVLGVGTSLGVLALSAIPVVAAIRSGTALRPRLDLGDPDVRRVLRLGGWAGCYTAGTQVLVAVMLVLANAVEGGVVAYQVAFTVFLVPHALLALPVLTTLFPVLARHVGSGDVVAYARAVGAGLQVILFLALPAAVAMAALSQPLARLLLFGESRGDTAVVAATLVAFAPGLVGYGSFAFLTRALYALGDARRVALVHLGVVAGAAMAMAAAAGAVSAAGRVAALAAAHSGAYLVGAVVLAASVLRRMPAVARPSLTLPLLGGVAAAAAGGAVMWAVQGSLPSGGPAPTLAALVVAGVAGLAVYLAAQVALTGTRPTTVVRLLRAGDG
ncbi:MAG: hypothetical protein KY431_06055 [Actinobacteria bacterium]|nr:hypothetical protein [Actinomycetota bacterium]